MTERPAQSPEALAALAAVRAYLAQQEANPDAYDRAVVLEQIAQAFYDHAKFRAPGGEGLDGHDGPERRAVGIVRDAALDWTDALRDQRRADRFPRS